MKPEIREKREAQIVGVAYEILERKGFDGISMLAVAKAAKASNETLYRWYGDKHGLFIALVARNVAEVEQHLANVKAKGGLEALLAEFGPVLLGMLLGPRAIALNRAAAADGTGELGKALATGGRDVVRPRLVEILGTYHAEKTMPELFAMAELYFTLLIGDLQIRRVTGVLPLLNKEEIQSQSNTALENFLRIIRS
ncbi:TetR/AcrR family transcriptional regulator [Octadecabacter ascidiaceicola]|uniref:Bacterial regulatory proteins, tetR family n=1 Tax=Octadecabacter ascidiaceicola TaxID=1655543 RepID=A0A238K4C4_9RHOB|nr:TetR/AcrR family transcriptional regulator [Octadecabacter ascidiaceicola]SMX37623.1 Bacterial regulatory proteins, tetR family [Octadecabacter ascidiaceicola]